MIRLMILFIMLLSLSSADASDLRWFEVEVLIFDRLNNESLATSSEARVAGSLPENTIDIITPHLNPDLTSFRTALTDCPIPWRIDTQLGIQGYAQNAEPKLSDKHPKTSTFGPLASWLLSDIEDYHTIVRPSWQAYQDCQLDAMFTSHSSISRSVTVRETTPQMIDALARVHQQQPYFLPASNNQFNDVFDKMKRSRGFRPLLHTSWRQGVKFGRSNAAPFRLYAGTRFNSDNIDQSITAEQEKNNTEQLAVEKSLVDNVKDALDKPVPTIDVLRMDPENSDSASKSSISTVEHTKPEWQIDGWFKVYLQRVGQVPYLHIDSELDYAVKGSFQLPDSNGVIAEPNYTLYPFKQLRRVISTQVHYFDHPMFGMLVQIRRFTPPTKPEEVDLNMALDNEG